MRAKLQQYIQLLIEHNQHTNLIGTTDSKRVEHELINDAIEVYQLLPEGASFIDVGSGAGLPGMVWAMLHTEAGHPTHQCYLIEPRKQRAQFLRHCAELLHLDIQVRRCRVESCTHTAQYATARAVFTSSELVTHLAPVCSSGIIAMGHKPTLPEAWQIAKSIQYDIADQTREAFMLRK